MAIPNIPGQLTLAQTLQFNETDFEIRRGNTERTLLASTTIAASTAISVTNHNARGVIAFMNISSAFPLSASLTYALKIKAVDPISLATFVVGAAAARSASGLSSLAIYPGIAASAGNNAQVNMALPRTFQVVASMSAAVVSTSVVLSLALTTII